MLFSSIIFICFFLPVVLVGNYLLSFSRVLQNLFLLFASLFFYAWGEPVYVFLMMTSILINYLFSIIIDLADRKQSLKIKKFTLIISIIANVSILFVFKYLGFVCRNINNLMQEEVVRVPQIILPIGISFFTFQALSYVVDVYRKTSKVEKNPFYLGLYISFFPQLIAGPIVQYNTVAEQIRCRKINFNKFSAGCCRFTVGFTKKIFLANNFAIIADYVYGMIDKGQEVAVILSWLGVIAYTLQIFYDFSAYSDMAIGLGLMFGFQFNENFNYPYISKSISEFWRRWHISLSSWFRDYIYIPLGGSRVPNQDIMIRNLFVVWVLTGIWHGAEWTFLLWGLWNFIFIFAEKLVNFENRSIPAVFKHIYVMFVVCIGWAAFRAKDLGQMFIVYQNMFGLRENAFFSNRVIMFLREYWIYWVTGIIFCTPFAKRLELIIVNAKGKLFAVVSSVVYPVILLVLFMVSFTYLVRGSYNPFIYFNF